MADGLWVDGFIRVVGTCGIIYMGNVFHYNGGFWHTLRVGSEFWTRCEFDLFRVDTHLCKLRTLPFARL